MEPSTNSIVPASGSLSLSDTDRTDLLNLAQLRWEPDRIAAFFGWDKAALKAALADPDSEVSVIIKRGELQARYLIEKKMLTDATAGNYTAAKQLSDIMRDRAFKMSKLDLFGGAEDEDVFERVSKYIEKGCPGDLSGQEQVYLDLLQMVYSMTVKYGTRRTVRFLTKKPNSLSYERAKDLIGEAVELFNGGRRNSKEALRHHTAECYDTLYHAIIEAAKSPQDYAIAAGILDKKVKLLQLNEPDVTQLPPEQYGRKFRLVSLSPIDLGLPSANRDELGAQIDALGLPDPESRRLKMEAGIVPTDITEMMHNVVQEES